MTIKTLYDIEDVLYIKHDAQYIERMVTSIKVMPNNLVVYELSVGNNTSWHFEFEVTHEVDLVKKLNY
jgi:hypothetical protein